VQLRAGPGEAEHRQLRHELALQRLRLRVVNGAIDQGPGRSSGHTWVETLDGRVIDPGWRLLVPKFKNTDPLFPERYWVGDSYRFESTNYPYLVLE
jgi:hypothetical protein